MGILDMVRRTRPVVLPAPVPLMTREAEFWAWFMANDAMLWEFQKHIDRSIRGIFRALHRVHPDFAFEVGPRREGRREFAISADGEQALFPAVMRLVAAAPPMERWNIVAFRPRRDVRGLVMSMCGDVLPLDSVRFTAADAGGRLDVVVHLPGCRRALMPDFQRVAEMLVSLAVGEFDAATRLAGVAAAAPDDAVESRPLHELPQVLDALPGN
jgi:hypothetical protein